MRAMLMFVLTLPMTMACAPPPPEFRTTATVKDIMDSVIDPSADSVWGSVSYVATLTGTTENFPRTDDEWKAVRRHAIALMEGSNMLLVPGRRVARPGEKAEDARVEHSPDDIEAMISHDRSSWTTLAHGLHDAATENLSAIEAKDVERLLTAGEVLDKACESCHVKYWYRVEPTGATPSQRPSQGP